MKPTVQDSTIQFVAQFEGLSLIPYQDQGGVWTIGYGATYDLNDIPITEHTPPISAAYADALLEKQIEKYADTVTESLPDITLDQNQFDACVSLCYNIGQGAFASSTVCKMINENNLSLAADAFLLWDKVQGEVNQGLLTRREKERALFLATN